MSTSGKRIFRYLISLGLLILSMVLTACSAIRSATYPEDFVYLGHREVTSRMYEMSLTLERLNTILTEPSAVSDVIKQQAVIDQLAVIEEAANKLGGGIKKTNHRLIDNQIDSFILSIQHARKTSESDPPNYYLAGALVGQCQACHIRR